MKETPLFQNNLGGVFLGRFKGREFRGNNGYWDLYYHDSQSGGDPWPTVLARYGDADGDYGAGLSFAWSGHSEEMIEARRRAEALGYDVRRNELHPYNLPQRGDLVHLDGEPCTFSKIANNPDKDGVGVFIWTGFPRNFHSVHLLAEFDRVTDLDKKYINWCSFLP